MKTMNIFFSKKLLLILTRYCLILLLCVPVSNSEGQTITVISNSKGAPSQMKLSELRSVLMGEKQRWRNGNKIQIALMKTNTPVGKSTCEKIYDMSADELKKFWLALVFQGKADAPAFFNTESELQAFILENPGAIGVVAEPTATTPDMQVILIDGKKTL
jgi:hypothetical protein